MLAEHSTTEHVERIVRAFRRGIDLEEERRGVRERSGRTQVQCFWDDDGTSVMYATFSPEDAAVVGSRDAANESSPMCTTSDGVQEVGRTVSPNLAELCWHHHWRVHEGAWGLVAEADGELTAIQPNGERLTLRSVSIDPNDGGIETRNTNRGIIVEPDTCIPRWYGDPLDLDHITTSLMQQWEWEHPDPDA
jgi:hypothetical protein